MREWGEEGFHWSGLRRPWDLRLGDQYRCVNKDVKGFFPLSEIIAQF
jgi:hypothetical protein